jgi:DNA modification methylase
LWQQLTTVTVRIFNADCREALAQLVDESVHCVVTSPPYWQLRDYDHPDQIGLDASPDCLGWATGDECGECYVCRIVDVFRCVRPVLRRDGTLWLNLGDTYIGGRNGGIGASSITSQRNHLAARAAWVATGGWSHRRGTGLKRKDVVGIPWRVALALQADGRWLRSDIIWHKPCPMPESVCDRPTRAHEYLFLFARSERYYYRAEAIAEPIAEKTYTAYGTSRVAKGNDGRGSVKADNIVRDLPERRPCVDDNGQPVCTRNRRDVWTIAQEPFAESHFSTFPTKLVEPCILAGCPLGGVVLDPFAGAGTTGLVADRLGRDAILIELNTDYCEMTARRIRADAPLLSNVITGGFNEHRFRR